MFNFITVDCFKLLFLYCYFYLKRRGGGGVCAEYLDNIVPEINNLT